MERCAVHYHYKGKDCTSNEVHKNTRAYERTNKRACIPKSESQMTMFETGFVSTHSIAICEFYRKQRAFSMHWHSYDIDSCRLFKQKVRPIHKAITLSLYVCFMLLEIANCAANLKSNAKRIINMGI